MVCSLEKYLDIRHGIKFGCLPFASRPNEQTAYAAPPEELVEPQASPTTTYFIEILSKYIPSA